MLTTHQTDEQIEQAIMEFGAGQPMDAVEFVGNHIILTSPVTGVHLVVRRIDWMHDISNGCGEAFYSHREAVRFAETGEMLAGCANRSIVAARESRPLAELFAEQSERESAEHQAERRASDMWSKLGPLDADD